MPRKSSENDVWEHILQTINPTNTYPFICTADDIKKCKDTWKGVKHQFEPRLLTYQTTDKERPSVFKEKGIYILPIQNGTYILQMTNIYQPIEYTTHPPSKLIKNRQSRILEIGQSECSILDNLRYAGLLERPEFLGEPILYGPLLNGRHRAHFTCMLDTQMLKIEGVQYEIDSCYESEHKILVIEAKAQDTNYSSFNIRQLYFPYRTIYDKLKGEKEIICAFLHSFKGIVYVWIYTFQDPQNMLSIQLKTSHSYRLYYD